MECGRLGEWLVDWRLEALGHRFDEGFDGWGFDEGDRCDCKPALVIRRRYTPKCSGEFDRRVRCRARDLEVEMQRLVTLVHQPPRSKLVVPKRALGECRLGMAKQQPAWFEGVEISGRQLAVAGLPMPILNPEMALLLHLQRR